MSYSLYFTIRQILMGLLLFLGLHMISVSLPEQFRNTPYKRSLRLMGVAFLIVPLSCFIYTKGNQLDLQPYIATAISLTAYFAAFVLMSIAFFTLLGRAVSRAIMAASLIAIMVYPIPLWLGIMSQNDELISTITTASYSLFIIIIFMVDARILYIHHEVSRGLDNYYSDDVAISVRWLSKSIFLLIGLSLTCILAPVFFVYPRWLRFVFMVYGVLCYLHIHYGYRRMIVNMTERLLELNLDVDTIVDNLANATLGAEVFGNIQRHLDAWLNEKGYAQRGITINELSKQIKSNRTYLSRYINATYNCSFKSWITQLRIEEARRLLAESPEMSIGAISDETGFASVESFTHIFTRIEGVAPARWRVERGGKE